MTSIGKTCLYPIRQVVVYKGHEKNPLLGPYVANIEKRIRMFETLNIYRERAEKPKWNVTSMAGEDLTCGLKSLNPKETLLVIPAGQSSHLDQVFSSKETTFLQNEFFAKGGRGYFNCGSAYWASAKRVYNDVCTEEPERRKTIIKPSSLPLFEGTSDGPLCPYPGEKYKVGFFSDAVRVTDGKSPCTIFLSGGGSFLLQDTAQKIKILVKYLPSELIRLGKSLEESKKRENAVIMVSHGEGASLFSMFHPYYGPNDIDVDAYEKAFPACGTNWRAVKAALSPEDTRMRFVLSAMLDPLENLDWSK